jgi:predicted DCC family thiol-disulfide oxidoreductase YuxK
MGTTGFEPATSIQPGRPIQRRVQSDHAVTNESISRPDTQHGGTTFHPWLILRHVLRPRARAAHASGSRSLLLRQPTPRSSLSDLARAVLLYDAGCRLCRFAARVVAKLDRRRGLAFLGLEDASAETLLERVSEEERSSSLRLVLPDGRMLSGGAAALGVLEQLSATRPFARIAAALHAQRAAEACYALVASNRDRLGRLVPDGPGPRRYP